MTHCFLLGGGVIKAHDSRTLPCIWRFFFVFFVVSCFSGDEDEDSKLCASLCSKEEVAEVSNCTSLSVEFLGIKSGSVISQYDKEKRKLIDLKVPIGRGYGTVRRSFFSKLVCLSHKLDVTPGTLQRGISHRWRDWVGIPHNWAQIASGYSVDFGDLPCGKEGYLPPLPRMLKKVGRCEDYIDGGCLGMAFNCDWPQKNSGELLFFSRNGPWNPSSCLEILKTDWMFPQT